MAATPPPKRPIPPSPPAPSVVVRPNRPFRIEQLRVLQELDALVVAAHVAGALRSHDFALDALLLLLAQAGDVAAVDAAGVLALELRQQPHVLVVWLHVHGAQDALLLVALERIVHGDGLVGGGGTTCGAGCGGGGCVSGGGAVAALQAIKGGQQLRSLDITYNLRSVRFKALYNELGAHTFAEGLPD